VSYPSPSSHTYGRDSSHDSHDGHGRHGH
jgi:hypothetical protein